MKSIKDYIDAGWVAILRAGEFTDRRKRKHKFDQERLRRIAKNTNKNLEFSIAPITATHDAAPATPKLGKIEKLKLVGTHLLAKPAKVMKDTIRVLKDIGYRNVSASINRDDTLNHLALVPNPAVSGLGEFPEAALDFSQPGEDTIELLIEFSALEQGNEDEEGNGEGEGDQDETEEQKEEIKEEKPKEEMKMLGKKKKPEEDQPKAREVNPADKESDEETQSGQEKKDFQAAGQDGAPGPEDEDTAKKLKKLQDRVQRLEAEKKQTEIAQFCDDLAPGVIPPKYRQGIETLLTILAGTGDTYDFSTDGQGEPETPYEFAKGFFKSLEPQIPLDPLKVKRTGGDEDDYEFSAEVDEQDRETHKKVKAIMAEKNCGYEEALRQVER